MKIAIFLIAAALALPVGPGGFAPTAEAAMMKGHHGKCMMHSSHGKCQMHHGHVHGHMMKHKKYKY